jgi:phenylacetate-coenzyme A ligase PaaK-like adenylate-forming protein
MGFSHNEGRSYRSAEAAMEHILAAREECYARFALLDKKDGLLQFLSHVRSTVPRYLSLLNQQVSPRLDDFPPTSKREVSNKPGAFLSSTPVPIVETKTSGTSGPPLTVSHDRASWYEDTYYAWARICAPELRAGFRPRDVALISDKPNVQECVTVVPELQLPTFRLLTIQSLLNNPERAGSIDVLNCRSSLLVRHISRLASNGLRPHTVICGGEQLYDDQRAIIEQQWKCRTRRCYATSESGVIATECNEGTMHITEYRVVEVLREGRLHESGRGELVVTNLFNWKMPFVRYRTGDAGELVFANCSCGVSGPCLKEVRGRDCDCVRRKEFEALSTIMLGLGITDYSVQRDDDTIRLLYSSSDISETRMVSYISRAERTAWIVHATNVPEDHWIAKKLHRFICKECVRLKTGPGQ